MSDFKNKFVRYIKRMGAGSMLISIIVHMLIISGATVWVVSSVHPQRKALFKGGDGGAAEVRHPVKMSNTQPHLDTLNKRLSVDSPNSDIALPDLPTTPDSALSSPSLNSNNLGAGAAGGLKGPLMPIFGFTEAQAGGTLVGNFYDFKQLRGPRPNPAYKGAIDKDFDPESGNFDTQVMLAFVNANWARNNISKYYQAPAPLYATQIFIPNMQASEAPKAYRVEKEVKSKAWMALYRGRVSPPKDGTYRFVGGADDIILVKLEGRLVLDGSLGNITKFKTDRPSKPFYAGVDGTAISKMIVGKSMQLKAGQFYDINIAISEAPGGIFSAFLLFEEEGATYEKRANGEPILPIFRVADSKLQFEGNYPKFMQNGPLWRALPAPKD